MSCEYPQTKSQPHFFLIFNFQLIKMFSDELEKISWEETTKAIYSKTDADVRRALGKKEHLDVNDFMALISPAATPYLEVMARLSQKYTMERFGKQSLCLCRSISPIHAPTPASIAVSISAIR